LSKFEGKIMRISSTDVIEGGRVLYAIGKIKAASAWHAANGAPLQDNWRELVVNELIRKAEDIDADAIIGLAAYQPICPPCGRALFLLCSLCWMRGA
jgi:hypothetical protein